MRWARSPVAPKMTTWQGRDALEACPDAQRVGAALAASHGLAVDHVQVLVRGRARCVVRAPWLPGRLGRRCRASAVGRDRRAPAIGPCSRLDGVAAELLAQRGQHLGAEALVLAAAKRASSESVMTGAGTSRSMASWTVQRPSPESATQPRMSAEVLAVLLEGEPGQLEQPRADDRAVLPGLGHGLEVERVLRRVQDLEALGVGLHQAVLDAVVDHLRDSARRPAARHGCSRPPAPASGRSARAARPPRGPRRPSCRSRS